MNATNKFVPQVAISPLLQRAFATLMDPKSERRDVDNAAGMVVCGYICVGESETGKTFNDGLLSRWADTVLHNVDLLSAMQDGALAGCPHDGVVRRIELAYGDAAKKKCEKRASRGNSECSSCANCDGCNLSQ